MTPPTKSRTVKPILLRNLGNFRVRGERTRDASNGSRIRASHARKNRIASFRDRPMVSRSDKLEIENSGPELSKSEEAVEVEVTPPVRSKFPQPGVCRSPNIPKARANAPAGQSECERRIPMRRHGATDRKSVV